MKTIYDVPNDKVLIKNGWKPKSDLTLKNYKKDTLIEIIRCLENNWAEKIKASELQSARLENFHKYFSSIDFDIWLHVIDKDLDRLVKKYE